MKHVRLVFEQLGGHFHCTMSTGVAETTSHAVNGTLVFDEREWPEMLQHFSTFAQVIEKKAGERTEVSNPTSFRALQNLPGSTV